MKRYLIVVLAWLPVIVAQANNMRAVEDSLNRVLCAVELPSDSVRVMCDLFDLAQLRSFVRADSLAMRIMDVAQRSGDRSVVIEMMRNRANINSSRADSLKLFLERSRKFTASPERDELVTLIRMLQNSYYARNVSSDERRARLNKDFDLYRRDTMTVWGQIVALHSICVNMARITHGDMLMEYELYLGGKIESLPPNCRSLRSMYYVQAAMDMTAAGEWKGAVEADRKLLETIDSLEAYYHRNGRVFRNFDANRYVCYTRLLSHWDVLPEDEIMGYYGNVMDLVKRDYRAASTFRHMPVPDIHMAMWRKDYAAALPLLRRALNTSGKVIDRDLMLRYAMEASRATGDRDMLFETSEEYVGRLEDRLRKNMDDNYQELQFFNDLQAKERAESESRVREADNEKRMQRRLMIISVVSIVLLVVLVLVLMRQYRRYMVISRSLSESNDSLQRQTADLEASRGELQKARDDARRSNDFKGNFIHNLCYELESPVEQIVTCSRLLVDGVDVSSRPYYESYVSKLEINCNRLTSVFKDLMHVYELESNNVVVEARTVDLVEIVESSIDAMSPLAISKGVEIVSDFPDEDIIVTTDGRRYQQIVNNLLRNAISRSEQGQICVRLGWSDSEVRLEVSDTGKPVDAAAMESTCGHDPGQNNQGLWFTVSRMMIRLLGGELYIDRSVRDKNMFVLVLSPK